MKGNMKMWLSAAAVVIALLGYLIAGPTGQGAYNQDIYEQAVSEEEACEVDEKITGTTTEYSFRNAEYLESHYDKHGIDMGYDSAEEYLAGANQVVSDDETLHKIEAEDGDDVYYREKTNEFVVISSDGYIRTYFCPDDGIDYFNRQ